jgi:hypothetical protein
MAASKVIADGANFAMIFPYGDLHGDVALSPAARHSLEAIQLSIKEIFLQMRRAAVSEQGIANVDDRIALYELDRSSPWFFPMPCRIFYIRHGENFDRARMDSKQELWLWSSSSPRDYFIDATKTVFDWKIYTEPLAPLIAHWKEHGRLPNKQDLMAADGWPFTKFEASDD